MNVVRRCIFHLPLRVDPHRASASNMRPEKMLHAFESMGYAVDAVVGTSTERKIAVNKIKSRIQSGANYDFLYSETSTMPTLLTDPDHLPRHPNLDFGFFGFCKNAGIPIGLFYRDYYWMHPEYVRAVGHVKSSIAKVFYSYDLAKYRHLLDILYLPSFEAAGPIKHKLGDIVIDELPSGCEVHKERISAREQHIAALESSSRPNRLHIFYVGGIGSQYGLTQLLQAVGSLDGIELRLCVRTDDWQLVQNEYSPYLSKAVQIVHASGTELAEHLDWADVGCLYFDTNPYMKVAMPYKTFEYLACGLPSITNDDTAYGRFTLEHDTGFVVGRSQESLENTLTMLAEDPSALANASRHCIEEAYGQTWATRAEHVARTLTSSRRLSKR